MPVVWPFGGGRIFFAQVEDGTLRKCDQGAGLEAGTKGGNPALARHALAVSSSKAKNPMNRHFTAVLIPKTLSAARILVLVAHRILVLSVTRQLGPSALPGKRACL